MSFLDAIRVGTASALITLTLWSCQGDDNTLPLPPDAGADAHSDSSTPHDGGSGNADASDAADAADAIKSSDAADASEAATTSESDGSVADVAEAEADAPVEGSTDASTD